MFQLVVDRQRQQSSSNSSGLNKEFKSSSTLPCAFSLAAILSSAHGNVDASCATIASHPFLWADFQTNMLTVAVNNYCICSLFLKRVAVAIDFLEALVQENPCVHMVDPIVFNICTLYDLSCSVEISALKKKVLQQIACHYHIEDPLLHWQSFRLN